MVPDSNVTPLASLTNCHLQIHLCIRALNTRYTLTLTSPAVTPPKVDTGNSYLQCCEAEPVDSRLAAAVSARYQTAESGTLFYTSTPDNGTARLE